jgi:hypothetical protein
MNVSHKLKLIWWAPPRNATRALSEVLCHYEFYNYEIDNLADIRNTYYSHNCKIPAGLEHYDTLLQVRNPYSRIVSCWHLDCFTTTTGDDLTITESFDNYVKNKSKSFINHYENCVDIKYPKYLIRYEFIKEDISNLPFIDLKNFNISVAFDRHIVNNGYMAEGPNNYKGNLKRSNNANYADWQSYYNEELADLVYNEYTKQFKLFNYNKNSWKL